MKETKALIISLGWSDAVKTWSRGIDIVVLLARYLVTIPRVHLHSYATCA